ncbi:hypothetical protein BC826DRAFT_1108390 [Russula brevipes]|nr:hypothetical protein BC826DRAFT_1108390 [Russula brevipes]
MSSLQGYIDRRVLLVLQDGRAIVGVLAGYDQKSNVVLSDSKERVYSVDEGVEEVPLGLYLVKGDMMYVSPFLKIISFVFCRYFARFFVRLINATIIISPSVLIGEIDEERDGAIDLSTIRADPIPPIRY